MEPTTRPTARTSPDAERGAGLIGTAAGVTVLLVLLLFATQLLLNLYATSVVTAAAFDAARRVATRPADPTAVPEAERAARRTIGPAGGRVRFDWQIDDQVVQVHVRAENRHFAFGRLRLDPIQRVDRTVRVRVECLRAGDRCQ